MYTKRPQAQEALDLLDAQDGIDQFQSHGVVSGGQLCAVWQDLSSHSPLSAGHTTRR